MQLSCLKENLAYGLAAVRNIANSKAVEHISQNVLLETDSPNTIKLSTTNLQTSITMSIPGMIGDQGRVCLSARLLSEYVQALPNDRIDIQWDKQDSGFVNIQCGTKTARIACIDPEEFPPPPNIPGDAVATFSSQELRSHIRKVSIAAAKENSRPILNGILFSITDNTYAFAAADGFRLAVQTGTLSTPANGDVQVVIPASALKELERILAPQSDPVRIVAPMDSKQVAFVSSNFTLTSQLLQGSFPNYGGLIPTSHTNRGVFPARDLSQAVRTAAIFAKAGESNTVRIESKRMPDPVAFVSTEANATGESQCEMPLRELDGDGIRIAFNSHYLQELLSVFSDDVILEMTGATAPGVFTQRGDDDYLHILMPMFVRWDDELPNGESDVAPIAKEEEIAEPIAA